MILNRECGCQHGCLLPRHPALGFYSHLMEIFKVCVLCTETEDKFIQNRRRWRFHLRLLADISLPGCFVQNIAVTPSSTEA